MSSATALRLPRNQALDLLRRHGDSEFAYLGLGPDKHHFVASGGSGYVAYREVSGFAVALGHPVGPKAEWPTLLGQFREYCDARRLGVVFCGIERGALPFFEGRRFSTLKVGDDARIELAAFSIAGRSRHACRSALNRAHRRGVTFEWVRPEARTGSLLAELEQVSAEWLARRPYPELGFALGTFDLLRDPLVRVGVARRPTGVIGGFVTWLPFFGANGWLLDLMRRRVGAMPHLMDFLITQSLLWFCHQGYELASLGGSPLSNVDESRGGLSRWTLDTIFRHLNVGYGFRSLLSYKAKFHPRWEPLYLACAPGFSLVRAAFAVAMAVATRVRPRHFLRAGLGTLATNGRIRPDLGSLS